MEEGRSAFKILTGKLTGKRPLGRLCRRLQDNIRMDFEEIGVNTSNWELSESPCECGIGPPRFISHGVSNYYEGCLDFFVSIEISDHDCSPEFMFRCFRDG